MFTLITMFLVLTGLSWPAYTFGQFEPAVAQVSAPLPGAGEVMGMSMSGRPILGYTFGTGSECLFVFGGIHGNEKGTVTLLEKFRDTLADQPNLVAPNKRVLIIPLVNPDGYLTRTDKLNVRGVNLNRNFPTASWIQTEGRVNTFAGIEPFSELESQVVRSAVQRCQPTMMLSFHSQGALVSPEAGTESQALGKWYAEQTGYEYFDEWDFAGTATGWFEAITGKPAITIELTSHTDSDWKINKPALLKLIQ